MRTRITEEELKTVRSLDAFTYFMNYRPSEIKKNSRKDYILIEHDSLHFSNGKWYWWSQNIGGTSALDFLMKVEGKRFVEACDHLLELMGQSAPVIQYQKNDIKTKFKLPEADDNNESAFNYLTKNRCLNPQIIKYFMDKKLIYQEKKFKNVVFVGLDGDVPKYAFKRGTFKPKDGKEFKGDVFGSNKAFSFSFTDSSSSELHVFESAIDMLSYMSLLKERGKDCLDGNYLSLAGASKLISDKEEADLPIALKNYLRKNDHIGRIIFRLDNDETGIGATQKMIEILKNNYECLDLHPLVFKDVNDELVDLKNQQKEF